MREFTALYRALDESTATRDRVYALERYFRAAPAADAAWALHVLLGNRPKRMVGSATFRQCAADAAGVAPWLFDACHAQVGDLAETVALLVGNAHEAPANGLPHSAPQTPDTLQYWIEERLLPLRDLDDTAQCAALQ